MNYYFIKYKYKCIYGTFFKKKDRIVIQIPHNSNITIKDIEDVITDHIKHKNTVCTKILSINKL